MVEIRKTTTYAQWFESLRDRQAKARIDVRVLRLMIGNPGAAACRRRQDDAAVGHRRRNATGQGVPHMSLDTTRWDVQDALQSPEDCAAFIEAAIEEAADDPAFITLVLGEVARSRGMARTARDAGLTREGLYKALTPQGNPSFATVLKVLSAMGLRMRVAPA
jgi:probable addiction module antidote protein